MLYMECSVSDVFQCYIWSVGWARSFCVTFGVLDQCVVSVFYLEC